MLRARLRRPRLAIATVAASLGVAITIAVAGCGAFAGRTVTTIGDVDFGTALPVPPLAESSIAADGTRVFSLDAREGTSEFVSGIATRTWGFDQPYLGPTIVADRGEKVAVEVTNSLPEPTTVHWHGMHLPAAMDGGPHQMVAPGDTWRPEWTIDQPAATLWYHPHVHGQTEKQVGMGMAGMVILRDPAEAALSLPREYGVDDVPVIVQDAIVGESLEHYDEQFIGSLGDTLLVNGAVGPYLDVTTDLVRLRLLNASPSRIYDFAFSDARPFAMIASDGGLLTAPLELTSLMLSPGERAEILVALEPGATTVLQSLNPDLGSSFVGSNGAQDSFDVLELRASATLEHRADPPEHLVDIPRLDRADATAERRFVLDGTQINQERMDLTRIDEVVTIDSTELWNVRNNMAAPHSFHIHDVQFQIVEIAGSPPPPPLAGWKDTIYLAPNTEYVLIMRFEDYADPDSPYMYHCHLLRHEDKGMMGQFVVVEPGQQPGTIEGMPHDH